MITIHLQPYAEKMAAENPLNLNRPPLYHQMRTFEALQTTPLVMNTYNTGTGKTIASLLHLFTINNTGQHTLFIAPTNALLEQHAEDIEQFVQEYNLNFQVIRVTAHHLRHLDPEITRPGKTLHHLVRNYLQFEQLEQVRKPIILVTNPDIFYYVFFFRYHQHDQRNLFEEFLLKFNYLVIDEFHYYDNKQVANFLFVLALFDQFGFFEKQKRRVCLLSATPTPAVQQYLDQLFGSQWQLIAPHNEPPSAQTLPLTPSLAPLTVQLVSEELTDWIRTHPQQLASWLAHHLDGAIISSSLWRVNFISSLLQNTPLSEKTGRITGPEPAEKRQKATAKPLILASPTVDIGYNFKKLGKKRQNIDFLLFDASYSDDVLQRLGRAGRVLGHPQTEHPSQVIAFLAEDVLQTLAHLDGQTLDRPTFNQQIHHNPLLHPKHDLTRYIQTHAITECFYPIYKLGQITPSQHHNELEILFNRLCQLFAPQANYSYNRLKNFFRQLEKRQQWFAEAKKGTLPLNLQTAAQMVDWLAWLDPHQTRYNPADLLQDLPEYLADAEQQQLLLDFVQSQITITQALFNFRDSFDAPTAVIYDPYHLLSSEEINQYDLFHLLRHYQLSPPLTRPQFIQNYGETDLKGDFYFHLKAWRDPKLRLEFAYYTHLEPEVFNKQFTGRVIGLKELGLRASEGSETVKAGLLPHDITQAIYENCLPVLIGCPTDTSTIIRRLRGSSVWSHRLHLHFGNGDQNSNYTIFLGKSAYLAQAELRTHFLLKEKFNSEAIIL